MVHASTILMKSDSINSDHYPRVWQEGVLLFKQPCIFVSDDNCQSGTHLSYILTKKSILWVRHCWAWASNIVDRSIELRFQINVAGYDEMTAEVVVVWISVAMWKRNKKKVEVQLRFAWRHPRNGCGNVHFRFAHRDRSYIQRKDGSKDWASCKLEKGRISSYLSQGWRDHRFIEASLMPLLYSMAGYPSFPSVAFYCDGLSLILLLRNRHDICLPLLMG